MSCGGCVVLLESVTAAFYIPPLLPSPARLQFVYSPHLVRNPLNFPNQNHGETFQKNKENTQILPALFLLEPPFRLTSYVQRAYYVRSTCLLRTFNMFTSYVQRFLSCVQIVYFVRSNFYFVRSVCLTSAVQHAYFGRSTCLLRPFNVLTSAEVRQTHQVFLENTSDLLAKQMPRYENLVHSKSQHHKLKRKDNRILFIEHQSPDQSLLRKNPVSDWISFLVGMYMRY